MKAILCSQYCQPDDLVLADVPDPVAGPNEAVIAIKSAALNFFDILMIQGKYQIKPPFPFSPAAEVAGVIESVGSGVTDLKVGDRVAASCGHNGAREKIALPANSIVKIPDNLDFDHARDFGGRRERERRLDLILALDHQDVEEIQRRGFDCDDGLARLRDGIRHVGQHQIVGLAKLRAENGFHGHTWFPEAQLGPEYFTPD